MNIIFVCTGNTCRSPMAEGLFKKILQEQKRENILVKSAGLSVPVSAPASQNAITVMKEQGIDLQQHRAQQLTAAMLADADRIYVMTGQQQQILQALYPQFAKKIQQLSNAPISDPFGQDVQAYRTCAEQIRQALIKIAEDLQDES